MPSRACGNPALEDCRVHAWMLSLAPKSMARVLLCRAASAVLRGAAGVVFVAAVAHAQTRFAAQPVGTVSAAREILVTATRAGEGRRVAVLTLGAADGDFSVAAAPSSCTMAALSVGGRCVVPVVFTPSAPGVRLGAVVLLGAVNGANAVLGTTYLAGMGTGALGVLVAANLLPVAGGSGNAVGAGEGETAARRALKHPSSLAMDGAGNLYIADAGANRIRMVCGTAATPTIAGTLCTGAGAMTTVAGSGQAAYAGDGGAAAEAALNQPGGVALDGAGNLFIADTGNRVIREVDAATGAIATVAGNANGAICGDASNVVGDGCPAVDAVLNQPQDVAVDARGNLFIADTGNNAIREVDAATGTMTTVAGFAGEAGGFNGDSRPAGMTALNQPVALAFDAAGDLFLADAANNRVREVVAADGAIGVGSAMRTVAGTGEAAAAPCAAATLSAPLPAVDAAVWSPSGVAVDAAGNLLIAEAGDASIRKVSAATGQIATLLANGCGGDASNLRMTRMPLAGPSAILLDGRGNLFIADAMGGTVDEALGNAASLAVDAARLDANVANGQSQISQPTPLAVENDGNAPLVLASIVASDGAQLDAAAENACTEGQTLAIDAFCTVSATLTPDAAPLVAGQPQSAGVAIAASSLNGGTTPGSPMRIELAREATTLAATTTTVTCNPCTAGFGQSAAFTIVVSAAAGSGSLTGTVRIADTFNGATTTLATGLAPNASGVVNFATSALAVGLHAIVATYDNTNDPAHAASASSPPLVETILEGTSVSLTASVSQTSPGQSVTFTATVTSSGGGIAPTGTLTFTDGATVLGAPALNANGVASLTVATLAAGSHWIVAVYGGMPSSEVEGSTSQVALEQVQAASSIAVSSNANPSTYGAAVSLTATVTSNSGVAATGTVNFLDSGMPIGSGKLHGSPGSATITVATLAAGTHSITAVYGGDSANLAGVSASPLLQTVAKAPTVTTLSASPANGVAGAQETLTAAVQRTQGSMPLAGTVNFTSGTTLLASAPLNGAGVATAKVALGAGSYQIVATYLGNANDLGSASNVLACSTASPSICSGSTPLLLIVAQATTQTSLAVLPIPAAALSPVSLTATVSGSGGTPTGTVNFLADGVVIGSTALANGIAAMRYAALPAGSHTMTAQYAGDANDAASASAGLVETIGLIPTTTVLSAATLAGSSTQMVLTATVAANGSGPAPTGTVAFWSSGAILGTAPVDASGLATFSPTLFKGIDYSIDAVYSGDPDHAASTAPTITVAGVATGFTLAVAPASVTVAQGQSATVTVTLKAIDSFSDTIVLGCASLPALTHCQFASSSLYLPAGGTASTQLTVATMYSPNSASAMNRLAKGDGFLLAGMLLPFGWGWWRRRPRQPWTRILGWVAVLALATWAVAGCSSSLVDVTLPGNYVLQVTGAGTNAHVSEAQSLNLTITN